ncbi:MAG: hypothetical protein R2712_14505 [Vicinamibacterales bacterium]
MRRPRSLLLMSVLVTGLLTAACGHDGPTAPTPAGPGPLTTPALDAMTGALGDEFRAEAIYDGVVADLGAWPPFTNVLTAEQRHSASIAALFSARGLAVPLNPWTSTTVPHFTTVPAACAAGVAAERDNVAMYDRFLTLDLPRDVRQVFENNRAASVFNHLPAFERCAP